MGIEQMKIALFIPAPLIGESFGEAMANFVRGLAAAGELHTWSSASCQKTQRLSFSAQAKVS